MERPHFSLTNELVQKLTEIAALNAIISTSEILPEHEVEIHRRVTVESTHSSTSIEGNPLMPQQVESLIYDNSAPQNHTALQNDYAEREVKNHKKAYDFVNRYSPYRRLTIDDILKIHAILMAGLLPESKVGKFREGDIYIQDQDDNVVYTGPRADLVRHETQALITWFYEDALSLDPIIAAAVFHYRFVSIHPFSDGNGRMTRLLTMLVLSQRGYGFRGAVSLDSFYSSDRRAYYQALDQGSTYHERECADISGWISYFADGVISSEKVALAEISILKQTANIGAAKNAIKSAAHLSRNQLDFISYIRQFGPISTSDAENIASRSSRRAVQYELDDLIKRGILERTGGGRSTRYEINSAP